MARSREFIASPRHELTAEEARVFSETVSHLSKGDAVRVTYCHQEEHRTIEGALADIDEALRAMRVGSTRIAFEDIESIEPL
ncbi:MAG: hypothetical protein Q4B69_07540 [Slackia sp.]|nr:hypothetical protein [Slackia sp.]